MNRSKESLGIFLSLVDILKAKIIDSFGENVSIPSEEDELRYEMSHLNDFFQSLNVKMIWNVTEGIDVGKRCNRNTGCSLKDYKLWVKLSCSRMLSISFDYFPVYSSPCHLE